MLSGVLDTQTGADPFFGVNDRVPPANLHPLLQSRLDVVVADPPRNFAGNPGDIGIHSEIYALNDAIWAREQVLGRSLTEADLNGFLVHNVALQRARGLGGVPRCANCMALTAGILEPTDPVREGELRMHGYSW